MKMKKIILATALVLSAFGVALAKPMNVVFILADDLGWADTTLYGKTSLYETPHLERLAKRGMTFDRAYANSPLCSPTRSSILTGQLPARHGSTAPQHHLDAVLLKPSINEKTKPPGNKALQTNSVTRLDTRLPTLGKLIKGAGYHTGHFGKWHLGPEPYSPLEHGFDVDIPHHAGPGPAGSFVAPWKFKGFKEKAPREHIEDRMAAEAVAWMKSVVGDKPWFMNYWMFSVHAPFDAKAELISEYRKKIDPEDPQRSAVYAAMIHSMDDAVGALLDAVDAAGVADNTVIIFTSDNGGNMYNEVDGTTPTSNFPLRGGKATMFEGGVRVPAVVVWPGMTEPGSRSDEMIQSADFYPTILNQLGIEMPADHVVDGIDITPALRGGELERKSIITYFPHSPPVPDWLPPSMSVHSGDWKLIRLFHEGESGAHDYRLFNLKDDIGEKNSLARTHPEMVKTLDGMIEKYIEAANVVVPIPNPAFDPAKYQPERIGVPAAKQTNSKKAGRKSVGGWQANGTASVKIAKGNLLVTSTGGDPNIVAEPFKAVSGGPFEVSIRMKSNSTGDGALYYNKPASADRMPTFEVLHDNAWHEYKIAIPARSLNRLRLDPTRGKGTIEIEWIRLNDANGKVLRSWDF